MVIRFLTLSKVIMRLFNMKSLLTFYLVYEFLELIYVTQSCHFNFYLHGFLVCLSALLLLSPSFCSFLCIPGTHSGIRQPLSSASLPQNRCKPAQTPEMFAAACSRALVKGKSDFQGLQLL